VKDIDFLSDLVGQIYDSAIEPGNWSGAFENLRTALDFEYFGMNATEFPPAAPPRNFFDVGTPWDRAWLEKLLGNLQSLPAYEKMRAGEIDQPMVFRKLIPDAEFRRTAFYNGWVVPQGLDDAVNTIVVKRADMVAVMTGWVRLGRRRIGPRDVRVLELLGPHLRRALLISGILDRARGPGLAGAALLDRLAAAALLVDRDRNVVYANAAAEAMLSEGRFLRLADGRLKAAATGSAAPLAEALRRAATGDDAAMENWGCATVLNAAGTQRTPDGSAPGTALAYVLPMGASDIRHSLGAGHCAVFIVRPGAMPPPPVELISAVLGLTSAEAACALAVADGLGTEAGANRLGIARNTFRKHLANSFDKTGLTDRVALAATINGLRLPLSGAS
jgi:DNA-binding CsgD family transcriptional regulator/PAS domain-containing protein